MLRLFRAHTLQKYVLKELAVVFALTLLACTLFLLLAFMYQLSSEYADKGVTFGQIVRKRAWSSLNVWPAIP